ncbi:MULTISPECIES: type II toxin-antitoxin system Phd/YefM family antitoxin [unclassified Staphylococcus]|uniref:type II toxin-antitoxin system Phd/YefM family antitoxin n=1 Tax=unclassified Staphylococcus TaxID=91994 RepID=UPI0021CEDB61|nr:MULTISPECIES: type II toxin-antitoxin system Phd/YefM family antitoxin [unclassified Staphylococcus]UXR78120.1 type II toxin-antitoxin system Phd/YefM family antitoxin [Staphylococcus sp. IVB6227]UXR82284.1 type II toxin-antitoxin system Phd/YefM family antitoxin [Staphylococcus sp. IVB6214]
MKIITPTNARKELYNLLRSVNTNNEPIIINGKNEESDAVLLSLKDWNSIQETLYLESVGVMDKVREREMDESGFIDVDDIDWDNL